MLQVHSDVPDMDMRVFRRGMDGYTSEGIIETTLQQLLFLDSLRLEALHEPGGERLLREDVRRIHACYADGICCITRERMV